MSAEEAPVLIVAGPTAVGKSALVLAAASHVGAEILSADSRQVYRHLDIGTAKPSPEERAAVKHHLVDVLEPGTPYSAGQFLRDAQEVIADVQTRGGTVIVTGGSTLYVHALVEGLADLPALDPALVAQLTDQASTPGGRHALFDELSAADPQAAATLDPTKTQRLTRFVGLWRTEGRRPSELWEEAHVPGVPHRLVVLDRPRADLYRRINRRVDAMMQAGFLQEVQALWSERPEARPLLQTTIGYRELAEHLEGHLRLSEAIALIKQRSRQYAKRQLTWYRRYDHAMWVDARSAAVSDLLGVAP